MVDRARQGGSVMLNENKQIELPVTREEFEELKRQVAAQKRRYIRPASAL
jgi:hypothetical protein